MILCELSSTTESHVYLSALRDTASRESVQASWLVICNRSKLGTEDSRYVCHQTRYTRGHEWHQTSSESHEGIHVVDARLYTGCPGVQSKDLSLVESTVALTIHVCCFFLVISNSEANLEALARSLAHHALGETLAMDTTR